jgi:hypothetical protein
MTFHVLTVGWNTDVIRRLGDPIEKMTGFTFSHILDPSIEGRSFKRTGDRRFFFVRDHFRDAMPPADAALLGRLEQPGVPTVHNMLMGDRLVRRLESSDALAYATFLARRFEALFREIEPSVIIGGFDGLHSGIAMAVARSLGIPWFAMQFTAIPLGMMGFCSGMTPDTAASYLPASLESTRSLAERTLTEFESRRLVVPTYLSANSMGMILKRLPDHLRVLLRALRRSRFDRYTQVKPRDLAREYVRKRVNLFRLSKQPMLTAPPATPYIFFGLHMQPESSIDVWAPFFADQFAVIEAIARSTPPTHPLLVKLHKSDADNYSRRQLDHLRRLPGVRLVSPYAQSRDFIEKADLVLAIQGNIAMEAALLGRPVLLFGDSKFTQMPSVSKVKRVTDLPQQIREKLAEPRPEREAILRGLMSYLSSYAPGCSNDWTQTPTEAEMRALAEHFKVLRDHLTSRATVSFERVARAD